MQAAVDAWNNGDYPAATEELGRELHCIQDTYAHQGLGQGDIGSAMHSVWDTFANWGLGWLGVKHPDDKNNRPKRYKDAEKAPKDYIDKFESSINN